MSRVPSNPAAAAAASTTTNYLNAMLDLLAIGVDLAGAPIPTIDQPRPEVTAFLADLATIKQSAKSGLAQTLPAIITEQTSLQTKAALIATDFQTVNSLAAKLQANPADGATKAALSALLTKQATAATAISSQILAAIKPLPFLFGGLAGPNQSILSLARGIANEAQSDVALVKQYAAEIAQLQTQVQQVFDDFKAHLIAMDAAMTVGGAIAGTVFGGAVVAAGVVAAEDHYIRLDQDKLKALMASISGLQAKIDALDPQILQELAVANLGAKLQSCASIAQTAIGTVTEIWASIAQDLNQLAWQVQDNGISELTSGNPIMFSLFLDQTVATWGYIETLVAVVQAKVSTTTATITVGMSAQHVSASVKAAIQST